MKELDESLDKIFKKYRAAQKTIEALEATVTRQREFIEAYREYRSLCFTIDSAVAAGNYVSGIGEAKKNQARVETECIMNEALKEAP